MKKFEKVYVGKGLNPQDGMEITRVTLKMSDLEKLAYEFEGNKLVTLEVARMKQADPYGKTHTVYGSVLAEEPKAKPRRKKATSK